MQEIRVSKRTFDRIFDMKNDYYFKTTRGMFAQAIAGSSCTTREEDIEILVERIRNLLEQSE